MSKKDFDKFSGKEENLGDDLDIAVATVDPNMFLSSAVD